MRSFNKVFAVAFAVLLLLAVLWPGLALAHETRQVGKYKFRVGWAHEPTLVGQPNGIDLTVTNTETGKPVEGLDKTLKAQVTAGGRTRDFDLEADDETPGHYMANFTPTAEGQYVFRFKGTVEGTAVDTRFESGPNRFDEPEQPVQFPQVLPDPLKLQSDVQSARTLGMVLGIIGIIVGAAGLAVGGAALMRRSRRA